MGHRMGRRQGLGCGGDGFGHVLQDDPWRVSDCCDKSGWRKSQGSEIGRSQGIERSGCILARSGR